MKRHLVLALCFLSAGLPPALAQTASSCFNTKMLNSSGATLRLSTGQSYMVMPGGDRSKVSVWMPLDKMQVCRGSGSSSLITNLSKTPPQTITAMKQ